MRLTLRITQGRGRRRLGFTLMEILAVMAGLSVLMTLGAVILVGTFRIKDTSRAVFDRQGYAAQLFDQFRSDVAQAAEAPAQWHNWTSEKGCLILRNPDGQYVVYRTEEGRLQRRQRDHSDGTPFWVALEPAGIAVEFRRTGPEDRLVTLRITQVSGLGASRRPIDVTAALGGDLR